MVEDRDEVDDPDATLTRARSLGVTVLIRLILPRSKGGTDPNPGEYVAEIHPIGHVAI